MSGDERAEGRKILKASLNALEEDINTVSRAIDTIESRMCTKDFEEWVRLRFDSVEAAIIRAKAKDAVNALKELRFRLVTLYEKAAFMYRLFK